MNTLTDVREFKKGITTQSNKTDLKYTNKQIISIWDKCHIIRRQQFQFELAGKWPQPSNINSRLNMLNNIHPDYITNEVSGMHDDELILGRPKGGVGILW